MFDDAWSRQLDGRVIYQHFTIFEPELRCQHFQRLARLAKHAVLSEEFIHKLAKSGPRERAIAFLLESFHAASDDRRLLAAVGDAYSKSAEDEPVVINLGDGRRSLANLSELLVEIKREHFDHFVSLAVGAVITSGDDTSALDAEPAFEGSLFGAVVVPGIPLGPSDLLSLAARTLMTQWWRIEADALALPKNRVELGFAFAERFGRDVARCFTLNSEQSREAPTVTFLPETPFCRDLALCWRPSADRVSHTIGSAVNHCSSLDDVKKLGTYRD